ncbi:MAG: HAD-IA family hydrolase [Okeania sp. SIO2F4]|uniref:HAD-IA family hydrolase n=1 Tax=Okeania sp. SIO2F4 TaxID=2607790 RepID=UPI00142B2F36|nr:HAD-IA family hydrolase [Okeania sp. SIO2F4]NES02444.1 HAD-IA family hydrolase [Okeania sp. SIO2F4]
MTKIIFLDAVGTLFGVRGSVGEIYQQFASQWGVDVSPVTVNQAFFKSFKAAPPMAFPGAESTQIPDLEFEWWCRVAAETYQKVGLLEQFSDFRSFFGELYDYFATVSPWFVYPDVKPALTKWRESGIKLAVLSNFDSRLYPVLTALKLADFFSDVTISTEVGAAKPDSKIFAAALQKCNCTIEKTVHIGDSFTADYKGAINVGIKAFLLNRNTVSQPDVNQFSSLLDCLNSYFI